jgi:hypothetical protein
MMTTTYMITRLIKSLTFFLQKPITCKSNQHISHNLARNKFRCKGRVENANKKYIEHDNY